MGEVEAVLAVASVRHRRDIALAVEAAMRQAILDAMAEGISTSSENSDVIRERMLEARRRTLQKFNYPVADDQPT